MYFLKLLKIKLPNPSRRLAGVRIGVAGLVSSSSKSTNTACVGIAPEVDAAAAMPPALDGADFVTGGDAVGFAAGVFIAPEVDTAAAVALALDDPDFVTGDDAVLPLLKNC